MSRKYKVNWDAPSPEVLPHPDMVRHGKYVASSTTLLVPEKEETMLYVWHWCDYSVWRADPTKNQDLIPEPRWSPGAVGAHDLISITPLHLEPSIFWPTCCGMHGFLRNGLWEDV